MEQALYALMNSIVNLTSIVGGNIWWVDRYQNSGYPSVVMTKISGVRGYDLAGPDLLCDSRVQFDCDALSYMKAVQIRDALRDGLSGYRGIFGGIDFKGIFFEIERNEFDDTPATDKIYRISMDAIITHKEK